MRICLESLKRGATNSTSTNFPSSEICGLCPRLPVRWAVAANDPPADAGRAGLMPRTGVNTGLLRSAAVPDPINGTYENVLVGSDGAVEFAPGPA